MKRFIITKLSGGFIDLGDIIRLKAILTLSTFLFGKSKIFRFYWKAALISNICRMQKLEPNEHFCDLMSMECISCAYFVRTWAHCILSWSEDQFNKKKPGILNVCDIQHIVITRWTRCQVEYLNVVTYNM